MSAEKICGTCRYWELVPQGCSSFWGRCDYPQSENSSDPAPLYLPGQDVHFHDGEDCPCWDMRAAG